MSRKFSKKISKKALLQGLAVFFFFAATTTLLFQNCSQVNVSDLTIAGKEEQARILRIGAGEVVVEVGASQYDKAQADFTVSLDTVPSLRQMWIIDNSSTMDYNNLNLSSSFNTMFDQSNKDSLYKFNTTAYLLSTAQGIPSYATGSAADKAVVVDVSDRQGTFFDLTNLTDSLFDSELRMASQNSGRIPGDNVGISVKRTAGKNEFKISAAPVLSKNLVGANVQLTAPIAKPANTDTANFENEFKNKLAVLKNGRVPMIANSAYQQSYSIIDGESGLCAVARVLENPNSMFTPSDMLAFTIVTDENDNDPNGFRCLKRTAVLTGDYDVINGKCSEYETGFNYQVSTALPMSSTCTVSGKTGYTARFDYINYSADVYYRIQTVVGGITSYSIPKTRISWQVPKNKTQVRKTKILYNTQTLVPEAYNYSRNMTTVNYYTKTCVNRILDGIPQVTCTLDSVRKSIPVYGDKRMTCAQVAAGLEAVGKTLTAVDQVTPAATADKLPNCNTPVFTAAAASPTCDVSDTANCKRTVAAAAYYGLDAGGFKPAAYVIGDSTAQTACYSAALNANSKAVTATSTFIGADKLPNCNIEWQDGTCVAPTADCRSVADSNATGFGLASGVIANGTSACFNHSILPAEAIRAADKVTCVSSAPETGTGQCPVGTVGGAIGCTTTTTTDQFAMKPAGNQPGLKTDQECFDWAKRQIDNKVNEPSHVLCQKKTPTAFVRSTLAFNLVNDNGSTLALESNCGASQPAFYNALSQQDKNKIILSTTCKIESYTTTNQPGVPLTAGSCDLQKPTDCPAYGIRASECSSAKVDQAGGNLVGPVTAHPNKLNMKADCNTKCNAVLNGFCEASSNQNISIKDYLVAKYGGANKTVTCTVASSAPKTLVDTINARAVSEQATFCPASGTGIPRYFDAFGAAYRTNTQVDEFVTGTVTNEFGVKVPAKTLVKYIKDKIAQDELNVNFTVFFRRNASENGVQVPGGPVIDYIGTHYQALVDQTGGQAYGVTAPSYADALKNLSAVIKSKLIRSFSINSMAAHQVITSVTIVRANGGGSQKLSIGQWSQSAKTITIANGVPFDEGDRIEVEYQNDDGYIKAQLKKIFIIDEMRPDQIVVSVEHIKANSEIVLLRTDQWLKDDNKIAIDPAIVINGGDQFRIKFKNNTTEE